MLVLDTGPLLALLDEGDADHGRCRAMVELVGEPLLVPSVILPEVNYWVMKLLSLSVWEGFVEDLIGGAYLFEEVVERDIERALEIDKTYEALALGYVDTGVMALCERLGEPKVATIDLRDFRPVVPAHATHWTIYPADLGI